jgi:hypothetical protein
MTWIREKQNNIFNKKNIISLFMYFFLYFEKKHFFIRSVFFQIKTYYENENKF